MPWLSVCAFEDVPDGGGIAVVADVGRIAVFRVGGEVYAMDNACSHRRLPLHDGSLGDDLIRCRTHGSCFDLHTGAVVRGPATRPVRAYATRVEAGMVEIEIEIEVK